MCTSLLALQMLFSSLLCIHSADPSHLGRLDYESLSQQALMEMVVTQFSEENQTLFKDENENYLDIQEWPGIEMNEDGSVQIVNWSEQIEEKNYKPEDQGRVFLEWLPPSVEKVKISNRGLEGELDCRNLPENLKTFNVINNRLTGNL